MGNGRAANKPMERFSYIGPFGMCVFISLSVLVPHQTVAESGDRAVYTNVTKEYGSQALVDSKNSVTPILLQIWPWLTLMTVVAMLTPLIYIVIGHLAIPRIRRRVRQRRQYINARVATALARV